VPLALLLVGSAVARLSLYRPLNRAVPAP